MANVTPIGAGRRTHGGAPHALQRRTARLERRILAARCPIVWLSGAAGCGKTWLLESLRATLHERGWQLMDEPPLAELEHALKPRVDADAGQRPKLLIASRPSEAIAVLLLKSRAYGLVETLAEPDLFVRTDDATADETPLLADTGGWPWLCAAVLAGRGEAVRALLPEFLEREVLPGLTDEVRAALCAALSLQVPLDSFGPSVRDCFLLQPQAAGMAIRGQLVQHALLSLRRRSPALRGAGVRGHLMRLCATLADPIPAIEALLAAGDPQAAVELFRQSGGPYLGYYRGYRALEHVLTVFGPKLTEQTEELFLARLWMLMKTGKSREALLRLEARHPGLPVDMRRLRVSHRPELLLLRADLSNDLDGTPSLEIIASWGRIQEFIDPSDELSRGLLYNSMALAYLQCDGNLEARQLAGEALAAYERARMPYLVHYMHVHLAEIALRQSDLDEAARHIASAAERLEASGQAFNSETATIESLRSRLAFERGQLSHCWETLGPLLDALSTGDGWSDLIPRVAAQVVLTALWRGGLRAALQELDRSALTQSRRYGVTASRRMQLIRIRLLQAARRHAEAGMLIEEYDLAHDARPSPALEVEIGLIRLRHALERDSTKAERVRLADALVQHPALETRQRVTLNLLTAAARMRDGAATVAGRHLRIALREAQAHGLVAVLLEDGAWLERLLPKFIAAPGPGNARLAAFAAAVLKMLADISSTPLRSKQLAGLSRQEHRVLAYAADGYPNKHIARALNLSESTVKFHLRSLFRKLRVTSRAGLAEAARTYGIVT